MGLEARFIRRRDQSTTRIKLGPLRHRDGETEVPKKLRVAMFIGLMLLTLGMMSARLVELTIMNGAKNRLRADENRLTIRPIRAARGVILDRHGNVLTRNIPIKRLLDIPGDDSGPIPIEDIGRSYPYGGAFAHVVGYVGEVSDQEISDASNYQPGDVVGKTGLEKEYDGVLRGRDGAELVEVDANGKIVRIEGEESPIPGENIQTSLDLSLEQAMEKALGNRRGAAVAIDPEDGSVLGLVSSPTFDPNVFQESGVRSQESENSSKTIKNLLSDTINLPLFNRAVSGIYPPGSIFKLVTATAGLVSGKVTDRTTITDTGELRVGSFRYGNWYFDQYGRTEGTLGIVRAIARSNDIFFYKVGEWVGPQLLAEWAKRFGLGALTGVDIPAETEGLVPDPMWKERQIGERWFLGNTYHMAIGQGDVRVTPLQVATMTSAVITGKLCTPRLVNNSRTLGILGKPENQIVGTSDSRKFWLSDFLNPRLSGTPSFLSVPKVFAFEENSCEDTGVSENNRNLILEGMMGACSSGGTAFPFFPWNESGLSAGEAGFPARVACKTGTAQHGGEDTKPHAWIVVAAPIAQRNSEFRIQNSELDLDSPKRIVLVVMFEELGEGSSEAGPVAKQILTEWFKGEM